MAGCTPAHHGEQQHLSRSAAACTGVCSLPEPSRGAAGAHDAAPALEPPLSPSHASSSLLESIPAVSYLSLTWSGKVPPGQGLRPAQPFVQG